MKLDEKSLTVEVYDANIVNISSDVIDFKFNQIKVKIYLYTELRKSINFVISFRRTELSNPFENISNLIA